jgi:hypothetical protein
MSDLTGHRIFQRDLKKIRYSQENPQILKKNV